MSHYKELYKSADTLLDGGPFPPYKPRVGPGAVSKWVSV